MQILQNIAITLFFLGCVWWFLQQFILDMKIQTKELKDGVTLFYGVIKADLKDMAKELKEHADSMGKHRKAIDQSFIEIQKEALSYKDLVGQQMQKLSMDMIDIKRVAAEMTMATDRYDKQYETTQKTHELINSYDSNLKQMLEKFSSVRVEKQKLYFDDDDPTMVTGKR